VQKNTSTSFGTTSHLHKIHRTTHYTTLYRVFITLHSAKGGADLSFMNNSIKADYETISQIIAPTVCEENFDLDDIFNF